MANKNDQNEESELPGYPHYPAKEDIMNSRDNERVDVDMEEFSRSNPISGTPSASADTLAENPGRTENPALEGIDEEEDKEVDDSDITRDDLIALGEGELHTGSLDKLTSDDALDIPGAEDDDANEDIGEEDEENNYYSLGGDGHDNLEEDRGV